MSKLREIVKRIIKEEILHEDFYDSRNKKDDWQYEEISDNQVSYLEELINDKFGNSSTYWYISFIDSFPKSDDNSRLFIYCTTDMKPIKKQSFRCENIEGKNLEVDGSLSSHEPNTKTIYQS